MSAESAATRLRSIWRCCRLVEAGILERAACEIKVGSSEGGNKSNPGSHHPIRSGAVRSYKATGHRHLAEAQLVLGEEIPLHFSVTAIEMVRGIHLLAHCYLNEPKSERDIWRLYRGRYRDEPFVRLVSGKVRACIACRSRAWSRARITATSASSWTMTGRIWSSSRRWIIWAKARPAALCNR